MNLPRTGACLLMLADAKFQFTRNRAFNASVGVATISSGRLLIAQKTVVKGKGHSAKVLIAKPDPKAGMAIEK